MDDTPDPTLSGLLELLRTEFEQVEIIGHGVVADEDEWWITFRMKPANPDQLEGFEAETELGVPTADGWLELAELVYWINRRLGYDHDIEVIPIAVPPHLNGPGSLRFEIRGHTGGDEGIEADEVVAFFERVPELIEEDVASIEMTIAVEEAFRDADLTDLPE